MNDTIVDTIKKNTRIDLSDFAIGKLNSRIVITSKLPNTKKAGDNILNENCHGLATETTPSSSISSNVCVKSGIQIIKRNSGYIRSLGGRKKTEQIIASATNEDG
ncbi:hypothetical protein [Sediminibacterium ginsengisoli]|uniref:hypothetical protein n=1 Tax=Sediminibacterium ginsengisoli TaxID=413434 RepID=UPI001116C591|nr:hypothetical protein [Sediminibacterium ginsengisoli]